jgi:hypothetical protein
VVSTPGGTLQRRNSAQQALQGQGQGQGGAQNVSANLHIPANKQRLFAAAAAANAAQQHAAANGGAPGTPGSGSAGNAGSPMRIQMPPNALMQGTPTPHTQQMLLQAQSQASQRLLNAGFPIQAQSGRALLQQSVDMNKVKPEMLISTIDPNMPRQPPSDLARRSSEYGGSSSLVGTGAGGPGLHASAADRAISMLAQAKFVPTDEGDEELREKLREVYRPGPHTGRATLARSAMTRVMTGAPAERVPEVLRALIEETEGAIKAEQSVREADASLPGTRKRRFQELADTVDRGLIIADETEMVSAERVWAVRRRHGVMTAIWTLADGIDTARNRQ